MKEPFRFGPDCGSHCGQAKKNRAGKVVGEPKHCDTCHTLARERRSHEEKP